MQISGREAEWGYYTNLIVSSISRFARGLRGSDLFVILGVAALYVACAKLGLALAIQAHQVTAVWPPTGFALAAVLRIGRRSVPGILIGAFLANATAEEPLWVAAAIAVGNTLEALTGAMLLRRVGFDGRLARVRDVMALLGAVAASPLVSATVGVTSLGAGGVQPSASLPGLWWLWWLGDALGGLIVTPFLLVWTDHGRLPRRHSVVIEGSILLAGLLTTSAITFIRLPQVPATEYVVFPFLIWAALRFGPAGTATVAVATNAIAVWGTHLGRGPFAGAGPEEGLVLLQIFMAIAAATGLLLGAVAAQNRQAQERAELSERRLLLAMGAARMGVWDWNIATGEMIWSEGLEPLHGLPPGGFAGTFEAYRKLIHADDLVRVDAAIRKAIETRSPYEAEFRIHGPDGVDRWMDARGQVLEDDNGRVVRMVGVGIDVSRRKELEEELRLQARQMAEADRRKDEFLAMLGHELRNPLAPIVHAVDLLDRRDARFAEQAREIIRRQSEHLTRLVDDLLDVSRITRGTVRLERRRVTLAAVVAPAVDTWRHLIARRCQQLTVEIPEQPIWLDVDPTRFTQVIANLLHNAAKFTPEEGRITITGGEEDGSMVLRVRDTGEGMSRDVLSNAFELFVQGPPPLDRPQGGLGLGLTLVRRLVELHGGSVAAVSDGIGRGSEFSVRVPIAAPRLEAEASAPGAVAESAMLAARRSRRILVVEDNVDAREALALLLEQDGHDVRTAGDGARALAEAQRFTPDVVLLDIGLPGLDGYAVAQQLRALPQCSSALLVAVTGYGQAEDRALSRAAGFDHHLLKPVEPLHLLELLRLTPHAPGARGS